MPESMKSLQDCKGKDYHPSLDMLVAMLQAEIRLCHQVFIVVDALDETTEEVQGNLLLQLQSLALNSTAKLLVTSRYIPAIENKICTNVRLDIAAKETDIILYLQAQLASPHTNMLKRLLGRIPFLTADGMMQKIIAKAKGMYVGDHFSSACNDCNDFIGFF